jgi:hypothetical protein
MSVDAARNACQVACGDEVAAPGTVRGSQQHLHVMKRKQAVVMSSTNPDIWARIILQ